MNASFTFNPADGKFYNGTTALSNYAPELTYGEKPTWTITLKGVSTSGISSWCVAIDKDYIMQTEVMARTQSGITATASGNDVVLVVPIDTMTERFCGVVNGKKDIPAVMGIYGLDNTGTQVFYCQFGIRCRYTVDPGMSGAVEPVVVSSLTLPQMDARYAITKRTVVSEVNVTQLFRYDVLDIDYANGLLLFDNVDGLSATYGHNQRGMCPRMKGTSVFKNNVFPSNIINYANRFDFRIHDGNWVKVKIGGSEIASFTRSDTVDVSKFYFEHTSVDIVATLDTTGIDVAHIENYIVEFRLATCTPGFLLSLYNANGEIYGNSSREDMVRPTPVSWYEMFSTRGMSIAKPSLLPVYGTMIFRKMDTGIEATLDVVVPKNASDTSTPNNVNYTMKATLLNGISPSGKVSLTTGASNHTLLGKIGSGSYLRIVRRG